MPLHRSRIFAGRETHLLAVARALTSDGAVAVHQVETAATTGLSGIGKTQLACAFVIATASISLVASSGSASPTLLAFPPKWPPVATLEGEDTAEQRILVEDALLCLVELGFVEVAQQGALRLHRLVVQFVLGAMDDRDAQAAVERATLVTAEHIADVYNYTAMHRLQPVLRFTTDRAMLRGDKLAAALATTLGHHLWILYDAGAIIAIIGLTR